MCNGLFRSRNVQTRGICLRELTRVCVIDKVLVQFLMPYHLLFIPSAVAPSSRPLIRPWKSRTSGRTLRRLQSSSRWMRLIKTAADIPRQDWQHPRRQLNLYCRPPLLALWEVVGVVVLYQQAQAMKARRVLHLPLEQQR